MEDPDPDARQPLESADLQDTAGSSERRLTERQNLLELTRNMARLPLDQAAVALETSASIAGVSLRASIEFLRAAPDAAQVLRANELHAWGDMGRRLAMADVETAVTFFNAGLGELKDLPQDAQAVLFQLCARQMSLANNVAVETFHRVPALASAIDDPLLVQSVLEVAAEIARRSAPHSAEFLNSTKEVTTALKLFPDSEVTGKALGLASAFASRAGGIAADAWAALPNALSGLDN